MSPKKLKVIGLFAGVGGIEEGFRRAGFTPIVANELDDFAVKTYRELHKNHQVVHKDVKSLSKKDLILAAKGKGFVPSDVSNAVLTGGFPCQPFSVAGYRQGFSDPRGNVFWEIHRLINELKPSVVFLENVKNLQSHDGGRTFSTIKDSLEGSIVSPLTGQKLWKPYYVTQFVLNAKDFGVPQNRERIFILGFRNREQYLAFGPHVKELLRVTSVVSPGFERYIDFNARVPEKYYYTPEKTPFFSELEKGVTEEGVIYQWRRHYVRANKSGVAPTLTANMGMGGHNVPIILTKFGIRKLTPEECFKLMGFKEISFPDEVVDSRLYKQAGNAVVVDVIQAIAERLRSVLLN